MQVFYMSFSLVHRTIVACDSGSLPTPGLQEASNSWFLTNTPSNSPTFEVWDICLRLCYFSSPCYVLNRRLSRRFYSSSSALSTCPCALTRCPSPLDRAEACACRSRGSASQFCRSLASFGLRWVGSVGWIMWKKKVHFWFIHHSWFHSSLNKKPKSNSSRFSTAACSHLKMTTTTCVWRARWTRTRPTSRSTRSPSRRSVRPWARLLTSTRGWSRARAARCSAAMTVVSTDGGPKFSPTPGWRSGRCCASCRRRWRSWPFCWIHSVSPTLSGQSSSCPCAVTCTVSPT